MSAEPAADPRRGRCARDPGAGLVGALQQHRQPADLELGAGATPGQVQRITTDVVERKINGNFGDIKDQLAALQLELVTQRPADAKQIERLAALADEEQRLKGRLRALEAERDEVGARSDALVDLGVGNRGLLEGVDLGVLLGDICVFRGERLGVRLVRVVESLGGVRHLRFELGDGLRRLFARVEGEAVHGDLAIGHGCFPLFRRK